MTLKLAETSVVKSRPSVPYGANLFRDTFWKIRLCCVHLAAYLDCVFILHSAVIVAIFIHCLQCVFATNE